MDQFRLESTDYLGNYYKHKRISSNLHYQTPVYFEINH
ncbi:hypothetical protein JZO86_16355 [Enterococcus ureasiticus]|nr:hypothetical protein [Enterococcus sp. DIV0849a]MBO0475257.1 hypothetical protein [Enterococcus ureasiticus]